MNKRLSTLLLVGVVAATAALLAVPAEAAPAHAARVPIVQEQIVIYEHVEYKSEITRYNLPSTCTPAGYYFYPNYFDAARISSLLLWVPSGFSRCNAIYIQNGAGIWHGECIAANKWGMHAVPPAWNDSVSLIQVRRDAGCGGWLG